TGGQLALERRQIEANRQRGVRFEKANPSRADHRLGLLTLSHAQAVVQDCSLDDGVVVDSSSGRVINADVATYLWKATLTQEGGTWKVAVNTRLGRWRGASDCGLGLRGQPAP